jgi:rhamnosyltransferase
LSVALLDYSDSNYFAFADQDDVWNKDKLAAAVARLKQYDAHSPNLYGCPFVPVNEQLVPLPYRQGVYYNTMGEACVINMMLGCTMVFNRSAVELFLQAKTTDIPCLHDEWLYKACLAVGGNVCYDSEPHILYRQHGNNVVGFKLGFLVRWRQRWHNFNASYKQRSTTLNHIWQVYQSNITAENQKIIKPLINPGTFAFRMKLVFSTVYQTHSKMNDILFRISYLCNRF